MSVLKKRYFFYSPLLRFEEQSFYDHSLHKISLFPSKNLFCEGQFFYILLNFNFRDILFLKKKVLPFFLSLELITHQKCVATLSSKDILI
jgi:hypothetical protein